MSKSISFTSATTHKIIKYKFAEDQKTKRQKIQHQTVTHQTEKRRDIQSENENQAIRKKAKHEIAVDDATDSQRLEHKKNDLSGSTTDYSDEVNQSSFNSNESSDCLASDDSPDDSEYESEGESVYQPCRRAGKGSYALARQFSSKNGKHVAVLSPVNSKKNLKIYSREARIKAWFFKILYPSSPVHLIRYKRRLRLILPFFPGSTYIDLKIKNQAELLRYCIAAIKQVLKKCHANDLVVVDLKDNNIIFGESGEAYLIDGGISKTHGKFIDKGFRKKTRKEIREARKKFWHIAPECWSKKKIKADKNMDIYSFVSMMLGLAIKKEICVNRWVNEWMNDCLNVINPELRPSLDEIEQSLNAFLNISLSIRRILSLHVDFSQQTCERNIHRHKRQLLKKLDQLIASKEFITACQTVNIHTYDVDIEKCLDKKKLEIEKSAQQQLCLIQPHKLDKKKPEQENAAKRTRALFFRRRNVNQAMKNHCERFRFEREMFLHHYPSNTLFSASSISKGNPYITNISFCLSLILLCKNLTNFFSPRRTATNSTPISFKRSIFIFLPIA